MPGDIALRQKDWEITFCSLQEALDLLIKKPSKYYDISWQDIGSPEMVNYKKLPKEKFEIIRKTAETRTPSGQNPPKDGVSMATYEYRRHGYVLVKLNSKTPNFLKIKNEVYENMSLTHVEYVKSCAYFMDRVIEAISFDELAKRYNLHILSEDECIKQKVRYIKG